MLVLPDVVPSDQTSGSSLQPHLYLSSFCVSKTLVLQAFCCRLTGLCSGTNESTQNLFINWQPRKTALTTFSICEKCVFWSHSSDLMRPTWIICQRNVNEGPVLFIHHILQDWGLLSLHHLLLGFNHSSMSKMSHSYHHSLFFLLFLLSH